MGNWVGTKRHGSGKFTWKNGDVYDGKFEEDKRLGRGKMTFKETGDVYEGEWREDKMNGDGKYTWADES